MAKKWYPIIDILSCIECGSCIEFCQNGVYNKTKAPLPIVVNPDACIDHCHECGNKCRVGAITYVGDDTNWTPPVLETGDPVDTKPSCGCGCGCSSEDEVPKKEVLIEYLFLDMETCDRCIGTYEVLDEAVKAVTPSLVSAGYSVLLEKIEMSSEAQAVKYHFLSSPTIRVNGKDIFDTVTENACDCCSEISGTDTNCRTYEYNDTTYEVPTKEMLATIILKTVFVPNSKEYSCGEYKLPQNLAIFFEGKESKNKCNCGGNCCG